MGTNNLKILVLFVWDGHGHSSSDLVRPFFYDDDVYLFSVALDRALEADAFCLIPIVEASHGF